MQSSQENTIYERFKKNQNITIRQYKVKDRWCIDRDSEEILIASNGPEVVGLTSSNSEVIRLYKPLISDVWLRGKQVEKIKNYKLNVVSNTSCTIFSGKSVFS